MRLVLHVRNAFAHDDAADGGGSRQNGRGNSRGSCYGQQTVFDGLVEAIDADLNMFGADRMLAALNTEPDAAPEALLKNVHHAADVFVKDAEQFDDMTMLCLEYKGTEIQK